MAQFEPHLGFSVHVLLFCRSPDVLLWPCGMPIARRIRRRCGGLQMSVRSNGSRRHPLIHRSILESRSCAASAQYVLEFGQIEDISIPNQKFDPLGRPLKVHGQVPGLPGDQQVRGMSGGTEDVDTPGGVLDLGQYVGLCVVEQVRSKEAARDGRLGLGAWERCHGRQVDPFTPPVGVALAAGGSARLLLLRLCWASHGLIAPILRICSICISTPVVLQLLLRVRRAAPHSRLWSWPPADTPRPSRCYRRPPSGRSNCGEGWPWCAPRPFRSARSPTH